MVLNFEDPFDFELLLIKRATGKGKMSIESMSYTLPISFAALLFACWFCLTSFKIKRYSVLYSFKFTR